MKNPNFTISDIIKTLHNHYKKLFWTGKIFDDQACDYKDLTMKDFENRSMHSFLFVDRERCFCERDVQISNSNFKIYEDTELSPVDSDLSLQWAELLTKKKNTLEQ